MSRQIVVDIVGDASKFNKATQDATSSGGRFSASAVKGFGLGVGLGVFNLATSAIGGITDALGGMDQAFKDDQVSQVKLGTALKNNIPNFDGNTKAVEDYAAAQQALGFEDDQVRDSIGQLVGVTHDQTEAMKLNSIAQDLARAKGLDLATAADLVTKAYEGNGRALKAQGIDIGNAKTATELLDAVQQNVKGSAEAWAQTSEGRVAVANAKTAESMEKIGAVVDKVASVILPIAADAFGLVADVVSNVADAVTPVVAAIVKELTPAFRTVVGFVNGTVIPVMREIAKVVFPAVGAALGILSGVFKTVFGVISTIVSTFVSAFKLEFEIVGNVIGVLGKVFTGLRDLVARVFSAIAVPIRQAINGIIGIVNNVIGAINAIQVHIHVGPVNLDWDGLNLGRIPRLHQGGIVPGMPGADVPAILQAGERVIAADKAGSPGVTIVVEQFYGSDTEMERFADKIARRFAILEGI
jgi:phage-related protein